MNLRLSNIQRFCTYDGPGIRTVVFTKGCSIRCPWCANPETQDYSFQNYTDQNGSIKVYGKDYTVDEVFEICMKDFDYYGPDGGVTASGGEALLQAEPLEMLFQKLKSRNVSCGIETSLYAPLDNLKRLIPVLDFMYVDLKVLDEVNAKSVLKAQYSVFEENLDYLFNHFDPSKIIFRVPIVRELTDTDVNLQNCRELIDKYAPSRCEIFSVHNLGKPKYKSLGMNYEDYDVIDSERLNIISDYLKNGHTEICINRL